MYKYLILIAFLFFHKTFSAQETEIFLFDLTKTESGWVLENGENISQNKGYDNQPSFYRNDTLIYSSTFKKQTDVMSYSLISKTKERLTHTLAGSEFSPQPIPESTSFAAVRLDTTGLQRLYTYSTKGDSSQIVHKNLKVAYYDYYNPHKIVAAQLKINELNLVIYDLQKDSILPIIDNIGRSIHRVPNSNSVSYTLVNENQNLDMYLLDMDSLESYFVCELPIGIKDYAWINETEIILGSRNSLFIYDTLRNTQWNLLTTLSSYNLDTITRIAVNPASTKLVLVAEINN